MSNRVIVDSDLMQFSIQFGECTVTPTGARQISGSGEASIGDKQICIVGDEKKVSVAATYIKGVYTTPGKGTITISNLAADQQALFATAQTPVIVEGSSFTALFMADSPAVNPANGNPDVPVPASGTGTFTHSQSFVTAG